MGWFGLGALTRTGNWAMGPSTITALRSSINEVLNLDVVWIAIDAGPHFSMALDDAGDVWCWGENSQYQLGIATSTESKPEAYPCHRQY